MDIYTSYYAKAQNFNPKEYTFLQISNSVPSWWRLPITKIQELVPDWGIVDGYKKGSITEEKYTERYLKDLERSREKIDVFVEKLKKQITVKNVVLLCYEKDGFCHRNIAKDYLNKNYGLQITEYGEKYRQLTFEDCEIEL